MGAAEVADQENALLHGQEKTLFHNQEIALLELNNREIRGSIATGAKASFGAGVKNVRRTVRLLPFDQGPPILPD